MYSIIIPTLNNLKYLKLCIESINKNSKYKHEIIFHINNGNDGSLEFVKNKKNAPRVGNKIKEDLNIEGQLKSQIQSIKDTTDIIDKEVKEIKNLNTK